MRNLDEKTVAGFGDEWTRFDQQGMPEAERRRVFDEYFAIFPWSSLPPGAEGFDLGCGSGRWAQLVAPRVGLLHCVDASEEALAVAQRNLSTLANCRFHHASVDALPLADGSMDFGYSLGVLHHVPDTAAGIAACVRKLKRGAPLLLYLYYRFDNRPAWFKGLWRASELARRAISSMPRERRRLVTDVLATTVYLPMARTARALERLGVDVANFPLAAYREAAFYTMRTDALDRFGTRLEQRFTRAEIAGMMGSAGLERISFSEAVPFWCAVGHRA